MEQVTEVLQSVWELPALLSEADTAVRADVYRSLGLRLTYRREEQAEFVRVDASLPCVHLMRVGGGTRPSSPRAAGSVQFDLLSGDLVLPSPQPVQPR